MYSNMLPNVGSNKKHWIKAEPSRALIMVYWTNNAWNIRFLTLVPYVNLRHLVSRVKLAETMLRPVKAWKAFCSGRFLVSLTALQIICCGSERILSKGICVNPRKDTHGITKGDCFYTIQYLARHPYIK